LLSVPLLKLISPGVVQLPRDRLLKALKSAKGASLGIVELAPEKLSLGRNPSTSAQQFTLTSAQDEVATLSPEDFPAFEAPELTEPVQVVAWRLRHLIEATIYAADSYCGRYALAGVALEFTDGRFSLVATDGVRLAHAYAPAAGKLSP